MNAKLARLLRGQTDPGIYRFDSVMTVDAIRSASEDRGWRFYYLNGQNIASKRDFLEACAQEMRFPSYFGGNWDALEDSLRDLSWAPAQAGYLLSFDNARVFAAAQPREFQVALAILGSVVESWRATATPMLVLLRGTGRAAKDIPKL